MNIKHKFKSLSLSNKKLLGLSVVIIMAIALPIFLWAIINLTFNPNKKAGGLPATPPVTESCVASNNSIIVTPLGDSSSSCHDIQAAINAVNGDGYTISINRGDYNITNTINIANKTNLTIIGNVEGSPDEAWLSFNTTNGGGYGIKITSSSGSIQNLHLEGITPNGLLSIQSSSNFSVGFSKLVATSSHTFDAQFSNSISVYNSEVISSAGALEFRNSSGVHVSNNKIHNSNDGIVITDSQNIEITKNLISDNRNSGIDTYNTSTINIIHNSIINNALNSSTIPSIYMAGTTTGSKEFTNNIIAHGQGPGIKVENTTGTLLFQNNDVWNSGSNYVGMADQTGIDGNISSDPHINSSPSAWYCLLSALPAIYGTREGDYMGYTGLCSSAPTPAPSSPPINISGSPFLGSSAAPVTMIEFGDFQCSFCKSFHDNTLQALLSEYPSQVRFVWKNFPLTSIHPQSFQAAKAAMCANDQNKFWEMSDYLFANQDSLTSSTYHALAQTLGLNLSQFDNCFNSNNYSTFINSDIQDGQNAGVTGTPTFFINGQLVQGALPLSYFEGVINNILATTTPHPTPSPSPTPIPPGTECGLCGGIAGFVCQQGLVCQMPRFGNPDQAGICVKSDGTSHCSTPLPIVTPSSTPSPSPFPVPGDVNGDGHVTIVDLGIVIDNYQSSPILNRRADLNNDGVINIVDIGIIIDNYGT